MEHLDTQPSLRNSSKELLLSIPFFSKVLLCSEGLGKTAQKGPSQLCDFYKIAHQKRKKKKKRKEKKKRARERNCMRVLFSLQSLATRSTKSIRWQSRYEKLSWFGPKYCRKPVLLGPEAEKKEKEKVFCTSYALAVLRLPHNSQENFECSKHFL